MNYTVFLIGNQKITKKSKKRKKKKIKENIFVKNILQMAGVKLTEN